MSDLISIIVPVFNAEKTIGRCIDSVVAQSYKNFELILIDDGCSDNSNAICDNYADRDSRIHVIHKPNGGVSSARNAGLDHANGNWIAFVDADDWIGEGFLEAFAKHLTEKDDMFIQGVILEKSNSTIDWPNISLATWDACKLFLYEKLRGVVWNKLFKKDIIADHRLRFKTNMHFLEDECFVLQYLRFCSFIRFIDEANYHYYEPVWNGKYNYNNVHVQEERFNDAFRLDCLDEETRRSYANNFLNALVESTMRNNVCFEDYRSKILILKPYSYLVVGYLNKITMHSAARLSYCLLKTLGIIHRI